MSELDPRNENPYAPPIAQPPPQAASPPSVRDALGVALPLVLIALTIAHVSNACTFVYDPATWDLLRGGICFALAACCLWILFLRRFALVGFFFFSVAAIPIQVMKSPFPTVTVVFYAFQTLIVLALVWERRRVFR